jgi:hypothetical protein
VKIFWNKKFLNRIKIVQNLVGFPSDTNFPQIWVNVTLTLYTNLFSYHPYYIHKAQKLVDFHSNVPRTLKNTKSVISGFRRYVDYIYMCVCVCDQRSFGDFTQRRLVAPYRWFSSPFLFYLQGTNLTFENRIDYPPTMRKTLKGSRSTNQICIHHNLTIENLGLKIIDLVSMARFTYLVRISCSNKLFFLLQD